MYLRIARRLELPKRTTILIHAGIWMWLSLGGLVGLELESLSGEGLIGGYTVHLFSSWAATLVVYLDENVVWITSTVVALALPYLLRPMHQSQFLQCLDAGIHGLYVRSIGQVWSLVAAVLDTLCGRRDGIRLVESTKARVRL